MISYSYCATITWYIRDLRLGLSCEICHANYPRVCQLQGEAAYLWYDASCAYGSSINGTLVGVLPIPSGRCGSIFAMAKEEIDQYQEVSSQVLRREGQQCMFFVYAFSCVSLILGYTCTKPDLQLAMERYDVVDP